MIQVFSDYEESQKIVTIYARMKNGFYNTDELKPDEELKELMNVAFDKEIPSERDYYRRQVEDVDAGREIKYF